MAKVKKEAKRTSRRTKYVHAFGNMAKHGIDGNDVHTKGDTPSGNLAADIPGAANIKAYADIVRERSIMRQLIGPELFIQRAVGMLKPAYDGSPLGWHQDTVVGPKPYPEVGGHCYTVWTAINSADAENGALVILPGSHRHSS
mgnify:CR=1 FL=1